MATQLNYDLIPDKSPLYTTVDQLNQSTADFTFTAANAGKQAVTINAIEIELIKVVAGADAVKLLLPGSEGGIGFPNSFSGPAGSTWSVIPNGGQFTLKPQHSVTFQPGDKISLVLSNAVIREGGTGTALVPVLEGGGSGKTQTTEVGIGITQSTLAVELSADSILIEPGQTVTLKWTTQDANSGVLTMPGNTPDTKILDSTNLSTGQQVVAPIGNTSYSLTCHGRGPAVMSQVTVSIAEVQAEFFGSASAFGVDETIALSWQTSYATSCTLGTNLDSVTYAVPFSNDHRSSCNVGATADGTTLILTHADDPHQEIGRFTLPVPCPPSVTFILTVGGNKTTVQQLFVVDLTRPQLISCNANISTDPAGGDSPWWLELDWNVSHASAVQVIVACDSVATPPYGPSREQVSTSAKGRWSSESYHYMDAPVVTITCQGFGSAVFQPPDTMVDD